MYNLEFSEFVAQCCQDMAVEDFVECFFDGNVTKTAAAFNVSRQTMHAWINDDSYEIQVIYHKFPNGLITHDYLLKKEVKRVGAINKDMSDPIGYVYAISNGSVTKIGASKKPEERIKKVARDIGFEDYKTYISNPCVNYKTAEKAAHKALVSLKRDNTIYQRECFSCCIEKAIEAIEPLIDDIPSGPRKTSDYIINQLMSAANEKLQGGNDTTEE